MVGRELLSQDFGTGGAVTNPNVVFRSLRDILNRWFLVNSENCSDDFWSWEPPWCAASARFGTREFLNTLEYGVNEEKSKHGCEIPLLGLLFTSCEGGPRVGNRCCRREPPAQECEEMARARPLAGAASTCIGKLVFASRGLHGKAGAHARRPLFEALGNMDAIQKAGAWPPPVQVA